MISSKFLLQQHGHTKIINLISLCHSVFPSSLISSSLATVTTAASGALNIGLSGTVMIVSLRYQSIFSQQSLCTKIVLIGVS